MFDREFVSIVHRFAEHLCLEAAALGAIIEVESGGRVFARVKGRKEPLIRFEGHYFYRLLPAARRNTAIVQGLAHQKAGKIRNPRTQDRRWKLLSHAMAIDREAALQSTSWGLGQVMGLHWRWLGYASTDAMVARIRDGAEGQIEAMLRYIEKAGLGGFIRERDWAGFARAYNGPAYARHGYDRKIGDAYRRLKKTLGREDPPRFSSRHQVFTLRLGARGDGVRAAQRALAALGYPLAADGDFGPVTRATVIAFQRDQGLRTDGVIGPKTLERMTRGLPQPGNQLAGARL